MLQIVKDVIVIERMWVLPEVLDTTIAIEVKMTGICTTESVSSSVSFMSQ